MPSYDYVCPECQHIQEIRHGMLENPAVSCPECGAPMERAISGGGAAFVQGGKQSAALRQKADDKFRDDMAYAREKLPWMNKGPQPKVTPQMFREEPEQPSPPPKQPEKKTEPSKD